MLLFKRNKQKKMIIFTLGLFIFLISPFITKVVLKDDNNSCLVQEDYDLYSKNNKTPRNSVLHGYINITNYKLNNTSHYHNETVPIEGRIYEIVPPNDGIPNLKVGVYINGREYDMFNNKTDANGYFVINNFTIPLDLNIYTHHKIEVDIIEDTGNYDYDKINHLILEVNATSYFDITSLSPAIPGEDYAIIHGTHRYDNGTGIPTQQLSISWSNKSIKFSENPFFTPNDGSLSDLIQVPNYNYSNSLFLNISYSGNPPYYNINNTQSERSINLFRNITCDWTTTSSATEGAQITISGQIFARNDTNIQINNRDVDLFYDGQLAGTVTTNDIGIFQLTFQDPGGVGNKVIQVAIVHNLGPGINIYSNTSHIISITAAIPSETSSPSGKDQPEDPPFFNFFLVVIPIVIGGAVAFAIYAYFFLKKQEEVSKLVKLPLEGRIRNLKILKETGRLEEALSYLFQSIYLELIKAKYGRIKQPTETIRDFAIISVRELNLKPNNIYPFIQNVEKIIYDKPFIINENDFYTAVALFSPIYFELTGYNFVLNF